MASLETAAKDWLSDPPWNKLFKTSFDVIEDQINRGLVALAAISLAVRFLANLPSGDLLCIVVGVESDELDMKTLSGPFHASLAAYAAQNPACHESLFVDEDHPWKVRRKIILIGFYSFSMFFILFTGAWFHNLRTSDHDASSHPTDCY